MQAFLSKWLRWRFYNVINCFWTVNLLNMKYVTMLLDSWGSSWGIAEYHRYCFLQILWAPIIVQIEHLLGRSERYIMYPDFRICWSVQMLFTSNEICMTEALHYYNLRFSLMLQATSRLRERGCDGSLAGLEVQQLFCSQSLAIPEHHLKDLNLKIDSTLQVRPSLCCSGDRCVNCRWLQCVSISLCKILNLPTCDIFYFSIVRVLQAYRMALESLGHCEYAMKAGFHLSPKAIEECLKVTTLVHFWRGK